MGLGLAVARTIVDAHRGRSGPSATRAAARSSASSSRRPRRHRSSRRRNRRSSSRHERPRRPRRRRRRFAAHGADAHAARRRPRGPRGYASAGEFLIAATPDTAGCLLLDMRLPGPSGLDLQQALAARGSTMPIVFLSGHGDIASSVRAIKAGARDFLTKPVGRADAARGGRRSARLRRAGAGQARAGPRPARTLRAAHAARARGPGGRRRRGPQQAGRGRARRRRADRQGSPRAGDGQARRPLGRRAGADGRRARRRGATPEDLTAATLHQRAGATGTFDQLRRRGRCRHAAVTDESPNAEGAMRSGRSDRWRTRSRK